jgi:hypothetical protein
LREAYLESKRNVDATLGRLERLQKEIRERQKIELQHARASKDSQLEEQRIDSELKREMTGIDASLQVNLTLLGEQAQIQVSKAIEVCSTVRSREDLERVLKQLLNNVLGKVGFTQTRPYGRRRARTRGSSSSTS